MKNDKAFYPALFICFLFLLQTGCKKEDNPFAVTNSIYGTYARAGTGNYGSTGSISGVFSGTSVLVSPVNSTYIKIKIPGYLQSYVYDSVKIYADRTFSVDQRPNGYHVFGSGQFGDKNISLELRNDSSIIIHKCINLSKLYDHY